jgi:hypothetical protein
MNFAMIFQKKQVVLRRIWNIARRAIAVAAKGDEVQRPSNNKGYLILQDNIRRTWAAITIVVIAATFIFIPARSNAQVANGSFETTLNGDGFHFVDWNVTGGAAVLSDAFGVNPTDGFNQAFITNDSTGMNAVYGVSDDNVAPSVSIGSIPIALGSSIAGIESASVPQDLSYISQTITVTAGQTLSFDLNFLTAEDPNAATYGAAYNNDYSFFSLDNSAYLLADSYTTNSNGIATPLLGNPSPSVSDYLTETGYQTYDYKFVSAGTYNLSFGVVDGLSIGNTTGGDDIASSLLVDNVQLSSPVAPAPEASTLIQMAIMCMVGAFVAFLPKWRETLSRR